MIQRTLNEIERMVQGTGLLEKYQELKIHGVSMDSRTLHSDCLFIPIVRDKDGHRYIDEAVSRGAAACLWQQDHPDPPEHFPVIYVENTLDALHRLAGAYRRQLKVRTIGITGSNGKTTTKDWVASLLASTYKVQSTEGSMNNHFGVPLTLLQLEEDTEIAVLEMGMSGLGEIEQLSCLGRPEVAVITLIGESHLAELGSREAIVQAKLEICNGMESDGALIFNGDDPLLVNAIEQKSLPSTIRTIRFGAGHHNDYYPLSIALESQGTQFNCHPRPDISYWLALSGKHYVTNALAALAVADYFGIPAEQTERGLREAVLSGMRMEVQSSSKGFAWINDSFNASPTSVKAAIAFLHELDGYQRKIVVLGDMLDLGEKEVEYHRHIGELLDAQKLDYVFTLGPLSLEIVRIASLTFPAGRVQAYENKEELAKAIGLLVAPGDVVFIKGSRGMKMEEVISMVSG
ncbi:UDP-N-acetylmuramoyl-tripeptide--D-alanyl-D-alanine ligase [Paenibacillus sp. UNC451MF]|uniref:UDP-N-acetylmuramoyl-tripeptide--D-alanyl-D- alanine ligase n=1 Tax=Paenibacillus sp. UNC451MF TaxID=1449063 RepID=UPI00048ED8B1|nr:UDP-N-acetylmuramoyl-tripeptide--D-alanyl-D-alanine ligase [Paenibacillus sp. UNC451MF]